MSELGYYEQLQGGIYGNPDGGPPTPESRTALQEGAAQAQFLRTTTPGYIPPNYTQQGTGALAKVGWTCQANEGQPVFPLYTPTGHIPDWTSDSNALAAGQYDMNQVVSTLPRNELDQGPIGEAYFDGAMGVPSNPNAPTTDVGCVEDLEY